MKGKFIDKIDDLYTMMYIGNKFSGFFTTNQEAWLYLMEQTWDRLDQGAPLDHYPKLVDIITVFNLGNGRIDIANIQTFQLEENTKIYTGCFRETESMSRLKEKILSDWPEAVTE